MIELDGSYGEGGGSLTRTALALSTLTGKEFRVSNIRAGRKEPGLKAQHLHAIKALEEICNAETNDVEIGSSELYFKPGKVKSGTYNIDIGTAGSITLLLQALILPCMFAPGKVTLNIQGGTCGKWQASVDYLQNILLPHLQKFAENMKLKVLKRGYYPRGGGKISLEISPKYKIKDYASFAEFYNHLKENVPAIKLTEPGTMEQIRGIVNVSAQLEEKKVAERIKHSTEECLKKYNVPLSIRMEYASASSIGGDILLWGVFSRDGDVSYGNPVLLGSDCLVEKGKSSEQIGREAAENLIKEIDSEAAVDSHLADQLIIFMALLPGSEIKTSRISNHALTNIYVVEKFLDVKFETEGNRVKVGRKESLTSG